MPSPETDEDRWRGAIGKALRGAPVETLAGRSRDGIAIGPLYAPASPTTPSPWRDATYPFGIVQRIDHPDPGDANAQAREDIAQGATGLALVFAGAWSSYGFGIAVRDADDLARALDGIDAATIALRLDLPVAGGETIAEAMQRWMEREGVALETLDVDFGLDPARPDATGPGDGRGLSPTLVASLRERCPTAPVLRADGRRHHAAGASEAQELAAVLSAGVAALRSLESAGLDRAHGPVSLTLVADTDLVLTIAKLRAARRLWARVEEVSGMQPGLVRLHVETSWRSLAIRDPHTNIVRGTIATAGAILGGADSVTVLPFTTALGLPDAAARRLARNTPLILLEEAELGRVADAVGGAGAVEALTHALCHAAWRIFQNLERGGGLANAMTRSWPAEVATVRGNRHADLVAGRAALVGVTAFVPSSLSPTAVLAPLPEASGSADPLPASREGAPFEVAP